MGSADPLDLPAFLDRASGGDRSHAATVAAIHKAVTSARRGGKRWRQSMMRSKKRRSTTSAVGWAKSQEKLRLEKAPG